MSLAEIEEDEERRGKKRNLDELESEATEPPYPKRRKLSFPSPSSSQPEKDATPIVLADCNHNSHSKHAAIDINHEHAHVHAHQKQSDSKKSQDSTPNATRTNANGCQNQNHNFNQPTNSNGHDHDHGNDNDIAMILNDNDKECSGEPPPPPPVPLQASQSSTVSAHSDVDANPADSIIRRIDADDADTTFDYLSIYTDHRCLIHAIPDAAIIDEFNERPDRLRKLLEMVRAEKWDQRCGRFVEQLADADIPSVHDIEGLHKMGYLADLKSSCSKIYDKNWHCHNGSDTYLVKQTFEAALISAGLVMDATKHVFAAYLEQQSGGGEHDADAAEQATTTTTTTMDVDDDTGNGNGAETQQQKADETTKNTKNYAVVLNRPPGHHANGEKYSGYCYINNTAVAVEKLLNPETRVLILDIDVHHGDGTQKLFYSEPTVLTVSFHQYDGTFFPISGQRTEYGPSRRHAAYGTNVNVPLARHATDLDVLYSLRKMVWKIVDKFKPDVAFYAVGTDGVAGDKANNATLFSTSLYGQIASELRSYCDHIIVTTEGGYTTSFLADGMNAVLHGLVGSIATDHYPSDISEDQVLDTTVRTVASTTSDLRRVYDFARDDSEFQRIFKGVNLQQDSAGSSFELYNNNAESMYVPNDDDELDGDYHEDDMAMISQLDGQDADADESKKKKKKRHKEKEKDRKKKKKKKKHQHDNEDDDDDEHEKSKKDKKSKKKKKRKHKKDKNIEVIDLIEESPQKEDVGDAEEDGENKSKKKKKKKDKDKKKKKKKHKDKHEKHDRQSTTETVANADANGEETENISNMTNLDNIFSLSRIIGMNGLALNQSTVPAQHALPALSPMNGVSNTTDNEIVKDVLIGNNQADPIVID